MKNNEIYQQFNKLFNLLKPLESMIDCEPMQDVSSFPAKWLDSMDENYLQDITIRKDVSSIKNTELVNFLNECKQISNEIPTFDCTSNFKNKGDEQTGINYKKLHEIGQIISLLKTNPPNKILEIGGGKGNLSYLIYKQQKTKAISIDMNKSHQSIGRKRNDRMLKDESDNISFVNMFLCEDSNVDEMNNVDCCIGLHTCGGLTKVQFDHCIRLDIKSIINIGCCYFRLGIDDINISNYAKDYKLFLGNKRIKINGILSLANRDHSLEKSKEINHNYINQKKKFDMKLVVQKYRQSFQYLYESLFEPTIFSLKSKIEDQNLNFKEQAIKSFKHLKIDEKEYDANQFEAFQNDKNTQNKVLNAMKSDIIRSQMGKPLEHFILSDRAIQMIENNQDVQLIQLFDIEISPRCIAVQCNKK